MSDFIARYAAARKAAIARDFAKLNPEQRRGVLTTEGALLPVSYTHLTLPTN